MVLLNVTNKESGSEFVFTIERDFKDIGEVKTAIHKLTGISEQLQLLVHGESLLHDENSSLEEYDIFDMADIDVYQKLMPQIISLELEWDGTIYYFHGSSESTVLTVKEWFEYIEIAVPPHRQVLIYLGVEMNDYRRLSDYVVDTSNDLSFMEIPPNPELLMTVNVIIARREQQRAEFEVEKGDTIYTLLAKARRVELIDAHDCYFLYDRMHLTMDWTFADYSIVNGDNLYVVYTE